MMNWFYKWLGNKISNSQSEVDMDRDMPINLVSSKQSRPARVRESDELSTEPIQFKMYKANGGWAIEFRQFDRKNDKVDTSLYVFNDEQELGKNISQIITMEALKR